MTCGYCKHETSVPDAAARRARMDDEAESRRQEARQQREVERRNKRELARQKQSERKQRRQQRKAERSRFGRWLIGTAMSLFWFGVVAFILYQQGIFAPYIGDSGREALEKTLKTVDTREWQVLGQPSTEGSVAGPVEFYLELKPKRCYLLALAGGIPLSKATLLSPKGKKVAHEKGLSFTRTLKHCAKGEGVYKAVVTLDKPGRFSWVLAIDRPPDSNSSGQLPPAKTTKPVLVEGHLKAVKARDRDP